MPETFTRWPTPRPGQRRITLLGCHHIASPGADAYNAAFDDPLSDRRQAELRAICDRLDDRAFDRIAVEIDRDQQSGLDRQFAAVSESGAVDDVSAFPDGPANIRSESVQIGFRLAIQQGHDRVYGVDSRPDPPDIEADFEVDIDADEVPYPVPDFESVVATTERRMEEMSLLTLFQEVNTPDRLELLYVGNVAASLSSSAEDDYVGSQQLAWWYQRNARMLENLIRISEPAEHVLYLAGASHVVPVQQIAAGAPSTCPRPARPLLED